MYVNNSTLSAGTAYSAGTITTDTDTAVYFGRSDANAELDVMECVGWNSDIGATDALAVSNGDTITTAPDLFNYGFNDGSGTTVTESIASYDVVGSGAGSGTWSTIA